MTSRSFRYAFLVFALLNGCSMYQNVTGYFNTYYNAKKAFGDAVDAVELSRQKARDTLYFSPYKPDAGSQEKFDKVIEKCSKLIQFYDKSAWVDDAILMIGQSYVYEDENESAIRKFKELFDNFPGSNLINEARLWNAKATYFTGKDDEALRDLKELFPEARNEGQDKIMIETLMLEAQIYAQRNDYVQAAQTYALAAQVEADDQLRAVAEFQSALAFEKLAQYPEAAEAYAGVRKLSPPFDLEFKARLGQGRMLALMGRYPPALREFETLFDEQLKVEEQAQVDLEIANTDWLMGDSLAAFNLYTHIDTTYPKTAVSAKAQYRRGQICERELHNYKAARDFYDKAKAEFSQSDVTLLAQHSSQTFSLYYTHYDDIRRYDSLLLYAVKMHEDSLNMPHDNLQLYNAKIHADTLNTPHDRLDVTVDTLKAEGEAMAVSAPTYTSAVHRDTTAVAATAQAPGEPPRVIDTTQAVAKAAADEGDDEDRDRPLGRRRQAGVAPSPVQRAVTRLPKESIAKDELRSIGKLPKDTTKAAVAPKPAPAPAVQLSADSLRALLAQTYFEMGGIFMLELQRPDSARTWFEMLLGRFPDAHYSARAMYALAELRRASGDSAGVDSLYNILLSRFGNSEYADQIRRVRGLAARVAAADTSADEFIQAYHLLDSGKAADAIAALQELVVRYPWSLSAPKAMYTIGWIYENVLVQLDSATTWYDRVVAAYPKTEYAAAVTPKLAVKKDPASLSKYLGVQEIPAVAKEPSALGRGRATGVPKTGEEDEDLKPGRGRNKGTEVDENADEGDDETPASDDSNNDDDDDNDNN